MKWWLLCSSALARHLGPIKEFHDPSGRGFRLDLATGETTWSSQDWLGWSEKGDPVADEVRRELATDLWLRPQVDQQLRAVRDRAWSLRGAEEAPKEQVREPSGDRELLRRGTALARKEWLPGKELLNKLERQHLT